VRQREYIRGVTLPTNSDLINGANSKICRETLKSERDTDTKWAYLSSYFFKRGEEKFKNGYETGRGNA